MDRHGTKTYVHSTEQCLRETEQFVRTIQSWHHPLLTPVITPRFIPTCTPQLLQGLGALAAQYRVPITSHLSESFDEIAFVHALHAAKEVQLPCKHSHSDSKKQATPCTCLDCSLPNDDTAIFDRYNLLTQRCIMAHGVHVTASERKVLRARGCALAYCPSSNSFFADGTLHARQWLSEGQKIGLGTDIAGGGYGVSILGQMRMAVFSSNSIAHASRPNPLLPKTATSASSSSSAANSKQASSSNAADSLSNPLTYREAFYLATTAGAESVGLAQQIGRFEVGFEFDAVVVDLNAVQSQTTPVSVFDSDSLQDKFEKFCNLADDRNVQRVWVRGRCVTQTPAISAFASTAASPASKSLLSKL